MQPTQPTPSTEVPIALPAALAAKLARLREVVRGYGSALVAFSGGADSALVLAVAHDELGPRARALTAVSPTMARRERDHAEAFARTLGIAHDVVDSHELERPGFSHNPTDRCYHCKAELLDIAAPHAERHGLAVVLLGTNLDDLGDHRPGLAAADERGARHPLVEAALSKPEVRALSRALGLATWDKPQLACLSSRFPYGTEITPERLSRIDRFEEALHDLGFRQLRVRFHDAIRAPRARGRRAAARAGAARSARRRRAGARLHLRDARSRRLPLGLDERGADAAPPSVASAVASGDARSGLF